MTVRTTVLTAATFCAGLNAGMFFSYAMSVMPALRGASDRTVVETMQRINVAILNGWFAAAFGGGLLLAAVATVQHLRSGRPVLPWVLAGLVLSLVVIAVTGAVNVPLNDALAAAGPVDRIADLAAVRHAFEQRWVTWNLVRTLASIGAFACLCRALLLAGASAG
jgi:uncharacterized membrane protein